MSIREASALLRSRIDDLMIDKLTTEIKIARWRDLIDNNDPHIDNLHEAAADRLADREAELAEINAAISKAQDELALMLEGREEI